MTERMNQLPRFLSVLAILLAAALEGDAVEPVAAQQQAGQAPAAANPPDETGVTIEVIGVYRDADVAFVREKIEALIPRDRPIDRRKHSWSASGNRFKYQATPFDDVATKLLAGLMPESAQDSPEVAGESELEGSETAAEHESK